MFGDNGGKEGPRDVVGGLSEATNRNVGSEVRAVVSVPKTCRRRRVPGGDRRRKRVLFMGRGPSVVVPGEGRDGSGG